MKKLVVILFLLVSFPSFSQLKFNREIDEFTGKKSIETEYVTIFKDVVNRKGNVIRKSPALDISLEKAENDLIENIWYFNIIYFGDLGCLSRGEAFLLFDDGEVIKLHQLSDADCGSSRQKAYYLLVSSDFYEKVGDDNDALFYSEQEKNIDLFTKKALKKIRIYGTQYYGEVEVPAELKFILADKINVINQNW